MRKTAQIILFVALIAAGPASQPVNLVVNGDFETVDAKTHLPAGWTSKHPGNVKCVRDAVDGRRGMVIEMTGDRDLMGTYGVDLISDKIAFKPNTRYLCTGAARSDGPKMIVFVKGYATINGREEQVYQMRKEIEPSAQWRTFTLDFDVRAANVFSDFQHRVEYLRITLWAYWPAGTCWYDDIHFEEVGPVDPKLVTNAEAVTHVGLPPRLATTQAAEPFDLEQTWIDAVNAFNAAQDDQALRLARQLLERQPENADYHLLAARALGRLGRLQEGRTHADMVLKYATQTWQREWAQVVQAEAIWRGGDAAAAKLLLQQIVEKAESENARQAARELLKRIEGD